MIELIFIIAWAVKVLTQIFVQKTFWENDSTKVFFILELVNDGKQTMSLVIE